MFCRAFFEDMRVPIARVPDKPILIFIGDKMLVWAKPINVERNYSGGVYKPDWRCYSNSHIRWAIELSNHFEPRGDVETAGMRIPGTSAAEPALREGLAEAYWNIEPLQEAAKQ